MRSELEQRLDAVASAKRIYVERDPIIDSVKHSQLSEKDINDLRAFGKKLSLEFDCFLRGKIKPCNAKQKVLDILNNMEPCMPGKRTHFACEDGVFYKTNIYLYSKEEALNYLLNQRKSIAEQIKNLEKEISLIDHRRKGRIKKLLDLKSSLADKSYINDEQIKNLEKKIRLIDYRREGKIELLNLKNSLTYESYRYYEQIKNLEKKISLIEYRREEKLKQLLDLKSSLADKSYNYDKLIRNIDKYKYKYSDELITLPTNEFHRSLSEKEILEKLSSTDAKIYKIAVKKGIDWDDAAAICNKKSWWKFCSWDDVAAIFNKKSWWKFCRK